MNHRQEAAMSKVLSILTRIAGSLIVSFGCGLAALFVAGAVTGAVADGDDMTGLFLFIPLVAVLVPAGVVTGAAAGATTAQRVMRRRSSFWKALLGAVAGLIAGGVLAACLLSLSNSMRMDWWQQNTEILVVLTVVSSGVIAGGVVGSGWDAKPAVSSGMTRPQQGVVPPGDLPKPRPGQARCPFCHSSTFRVGEETGLRRCSDCQSVLPNYILGNAGLAERI
jgi:hypothetical protein